MRLDRGLSVATHYEELSSFVLRAATTNDSPFADVQLWSVATAQTYSHFSTEGPPKPWLGLAKVTVSVSHHFLLALSSNIVTTIITISGSTMHRIISTMATVEASKKQAFG